MIMQNFIKVCLVLVGLTTAYFMLSSFIQIRDASNNLCTMNFWRNVKSVSERSQTRKLLGYINYSDEEIQQFISLVARKAPANDSELISFVRKVIDPPSPHKLIKMSRPLLVTPQAEEIDKHFKSKKNGFFVEAGALDGERSSNSIFFEVKRDWTGLLVEPDPFFYTQLIGKNRVAWSINACLSVTPFVAELNFKESSGGHGKLVTESSLQKVPCFPLETLLLAINVTTVDFFSLDVEGFELEVLKTIPLDQINIRSLAVEYLHGNEKQYLDFMQSKGYDMVKKIHDHRPEFALYVDDFIFVGKGRR